MHFCQLKHLNYKKTSISFITYVRLVTANQTELQKRYRQLMAFALLSQIIKNPSKIGHSPKRVNFVMFVAKPLTK